MMEKTEETGMDGVVTDQLAGFMESHAFFQKALDVAREDRKQGTLCSHAPVYLNLTHFKLYNAQYGLAAGDALLQQLAGCLRRRFPGAPIAHLSADNFVVLAPRAQLEEKLTDLAREFQEIIGDPSIALKAGLTYYENLSPESQKSSRHSFDTAKIAADTIKEDASRTFAVYTETMGQKLTEEAYVLRNFDRALEKGYIRVYYQPVVRTLTGRLCSMEALARWEDPEKGRLTPDRFIPVLEKARLIPKMDFYVIEQVAKLLRFQKENQRPILPISVNLSRIDFDRRDPVAEVEAIVERYQLPRNLLHIEVTETALARDSEKMQREIQRFREAGYECWLDDFGSGYSSFNVLQRFHFDEIKLDMSFQRHFNDQGRKILRSLVFMAKSLGIHTLAEGVETREQAEFLRSIGCEKIQGYYYGKPQPYEACHFFCHEQDLVAEAPAEALIMSRAGLVDVMTDNPVSVFWYDGKHQLRDLWENRAFRETLLQVSRRPNYRLGVTLDLDQLPALGEFRDLLDRALRSGREETLTYVENGQYISCKVQFLAGVPGSHTGRAEMVNITMDSTFRQVSRLDEFSRHLLPIYDGLYLYHGREDQVELLSAAHTPGRAGERVSRRQWMTLKLSIHPEDRQRFLEWAAPRALYRQAKASGRSLAMGMFRVRREDGSFCWKEFDALAVGPEPEGNLLLCVKDASIEGITDQKNVLPLFLPYLQAQVSGKADPRRKNVVLEAMKRFTEIKFFWKDQDRRFLGVSRAFLDHFGLPDEKAVLGKTDEDMGWHVDAEPFKEIEKRVLQEGLVARSVPGQCLIRGRLHAIRASKVPLYDGNRIVGLLGYFEDLEEENRQEEKDRKLALRDPATGLAGLRGMILAGLEYYSNYDRNRENFAAILFHIPECNEVSRLYGEKAGQSLLKRISRILAGFCPFRKTLGYLGDGKFLLFMKYQEGMPLKEELLQLADRVHEIRRIKGQPVTLYLQRAIAYGSETRSLDGLLRLLSQRLEEAEQQRYGQSVYVGDRVAFDLEAFDTSEQNVMLSRLDTHEILYMNKAGLRDLGLPENYRYQGQKCHKLLCGLDYPCEDCPRAQLRRDKIYTRTYHNKNLGRDYLIQHTLVPWRGQNCHFEMATNLRHYMEDEMREKELLFKEMAMNDILELALREPDPEKGIRDTLARVGDLLQCEKFCIFEEMPDGTLCNTYEWCREGIPSTRQELQQVPRKDAQFLYDYFEADQVALIRDVEKVLRRYGREKPHLRGLKSLISGQLSMAGRSLGFTEVVNPSAQVLQEASPLLATLTRFLAIMLRNRDTLNCLHQMSYRDALTGTGNRRAFREYVQKLPDGEKMAFVYGDMNGLKTINDHLGHKAGDRALCHIADAMKELAGPEHVFRVGGDEFILVLSGVDKAGSLAFIRRLKEKIDRHGISVAFGAAVHTTPIHDVEKLITSADREMYRDKQHPRK